MTQRPQTPTLEIPSKRPSQQPFQTSRKLNHLLVSPLEARKHESGRDDPTQPCKPDTHVPRAAVATEDVVALVVEGRFDGAGEA